jgi:hypothetical protein
MTTPIPAAGYPSDSSRTQSDEQTYMETMLSIAKEQFGGTGEAASVQLSSNTFTPGNNACVCPIDTNALGPTDTLNTIQVSNVRDGMVIFLRSTDDSRVITIANNAGGTGEILTQDGNSIVLADTRLFVALKYNAAVTAFEEVFRTTPSWEAPGAIGATTPNTGTFSSIEVTENIGANQWFGNNAEYSAAPTFASLTNADLPSDVVTYVESDLSPLFTTSIEEQGISWTQSYCDGGSLFGNFGEGSGPPQFNDPGTADQILGVTHDGYNGLEYKTIVAGDNITITPDVGMITISSTGGGGGGGGVLNNYDGGRYPTNTDDSSVGYSVGSVWCWAEYGYFSICSDATEGAAQWQFLSNFQVSPTYTPVTSDLFTNAVLSALVQSVPESSGTLTFPNAAAYIGGLRCNTGGSTFTYAASSWTYDFVDNGGNVDHYAQDYDTDPPSVDNAVLFQLVVTDDSGNITEINVAGPTLSGDLQNYAQAIPETTGLILQTVDPSINPNGINYQLVSPASLDPTGATGNQLLGFDGAEYNFFYGLTGVSVDTDSSISLEASSESLQSLDPTDASINVSLPSSGDCPGKVFYFANTASEGSNTVTVSLASGDVQVGIGSLTLDNGGVLGVISDGAGNWIVIVSK